MDALFHLRDMIASLDVPLTDDLCARARLPWNEDLYALKGAAAPALDELAGAYAGSTTLAGRVLLLRPFYVRAVLPALCGPGGGEADRNACIAADTACLNSLARRLALSIHVAVRKREACRTFCRPALGPGDPASSKRPSPTFRRGRRDPRGGSPRAQERGGRGHRPPARGPHADVLIPLSRKIQVTPAGRRLIRPLRALLGFFPPAAAWHL
jgi:hypothetical protein